MAASSRAQVLDLYRAMLRESKRFGAYNYRTYAIRRIRDAFRENKNVKDPVEIQALVNKAKRDLGIIRRQIVQYCLLCLSQPSVLRVHARFHRWRDFSPFYGSTLAKCIQPTSLSLRIKRSPGPRSRDQRPAATGPPAAPSRLPWGPQQASRGLRTSFK
ncbi:LYR motif-containing protein 4 isoform X1 [Bubalus kerabau]|uniref:LYR motif-containing protein 4 isoform X1 n=1 Tax=Bubalus bubalis TaxID=89462 RepID=UPI000DBCAB9C|nr:LYR motif-containing protein 4 isoform X1 [Bubalus bubalis]XP_055426494.1 LYR motif-containing protein 4 isoform X1 [Bubalus carabanensis]